MSNTKPIQENKISINKKNRAIKIVGRIVLAFVILFILLVLFIRSPWGQSLIKDQVVSYISDKTKTEVSIDKLFLTFSGSLQLDGLYLEDKKGDTLIYSKTLEANIALLNIIRGNSVGVDALYWEGVVAKIKRKDTISSFNFNFLIDAFTSPQEKNIAIDSTETAMQFILKNLDFKNFDVVYNDDVTGIDSHFVFENLKLDMETTNLESMEFYASNLELKNAKIKYIQKPVTKILDEESSLLPSISAETFSLNNVKVNYQSLADDVAMDANIVNLYAEIPTAKLSENTINIDAFKLSNSSILLYTQTKNNVVTESVNNVSKDIEKDIIKFEWPNLRVALKNLDLENNKLGYFVNNEKSNKNIFNANTIELNNFSLKGESVFIKDKSAGLIIKSGSFKETSGYQLKEFELDVNVTDTDFIINQFSLAVNQNYVTGKMEMQYPTLSALFEAPEKSKVSLNLSDFRFDLHDVFPFQPDLSNNPTFVTLSNKAISGNIKGLGNLSEIKFPKLNVLWGKSTQISANGTIFNITNPDKLRYNIPSFKAITIYEDVAKFIEVDSQSINLPKNISLIGSINGNENSIETNSELKTEQGIVAINGDFTSSENLVFNTEISINNYQIGQLLKNPKLGNLTTSIKASGKGENLNSLNADLETTVNSFNFNNYAINNLKLNGHIENGEGKVTSKYKDENINLNLIANVLLDSIAPKVNLELDLIGANLQALGLMNRDIRTGLKLYADFKGNATSYDVSANVNDGVVVYDNKSYLIGDLDAKAHIRSDTTSVSVSNKILNMQLESNTDPKTFSESLKNHILSYFYRENKLPDSLNKSVKLKFKGDIVDAPLLTDVFLVNIKDLDTVNISVDFDEAERKLKGNITAPKINYSDYIMDGLALSIDTNKDKFIFDLGFNQIKAGPLFIPRSIIKGEQLNNELSLDFIAYDKEEEMMNVKAEITGDSERLRFHVIPENLTLNKSKWIIPSDNEIIITEKKLAFNNFKINKNNQSIQITDKDPSIEKNHIALNYANFKISEFFNYLNPEKKLATGNLNGNFILEEPFNNTGFLANLTISKLSLMDVDMGILSVDGKSLGGNSYNLNASLKDGDVNLDLKGNYTSDTKDAKLNLDLIINEFKMKALTGFSQGLITGTDGNFSGKFGVNGTTVNPIYNGNINFNNAHFEVPMLNSAFTLKNEKLNIDNDGLKLNNFTILDESNNTFVASGNVGTETFLNPTFDLSLKADNFSFINASKEDNEFLYGKGVFDADAKITGDLQIPKIDMTLNVGSQTDLTYVLPSAQVNVEERDGVVIFVNRENPNAILTKTEEQTATLKGFDITANLNIGKEAAVTIIIDEQTGDNFKISGEGELNFAMNPNGQMNLVGVYNVSSGHYEMNLYNLVNRRFEIAEGSRVSWSGNPFDAKLDVRATYKIETSASGLMAPASSGIDASAKNKYKQVLPFYVYLNIDGELMAPKISFNLDMPEDEQGSIGGQVYGRVQQINQQDDELNKQVFSLLVLNRFYPDSGSDGSSGGFASMARDNLNDAVSDQLNTFSDKLLGKTGFELDFGLDSYTDYQGNAPQDRTQLDIAAQKKLFNDRLVVRVGSEVDIQGSSSTNEPTPLIGNVSLEYLLTEDGRYKIRGFRRNEFENVIDGQTIATGIALIFTQEFNKFNELWDAMFKGKTLKEEQQEEKAKSVEESQEQKEENVSKSLDKKKTN
ncbi:Family of unknown function [Flaviramulus basaltis]|uniref:Translocation and assembly module TamB C-terminal domain-containing protein n=1 Tax=Flaviramulus basaltis TaxID=369401 RepID=A0A1K2IBP5_9FLAO|nr:translocation/assembly module TamB domain-containing protein [Flaviramulus basaltis]SFZ89662.1 Family of unknown function [Flaviramulus basaltis]